MGNREYFRVLFYMFRFGVASGYTGGFGAVGQPCLHFFQLIIRAANERLDAAVGAVAHPASHAQRFGGQAGVVTEANTLHAAGDAHAQATRPFRYHVSGRRMVSRASGSGSG